MACVLLVGIDPDLVDFADPSLPPGLDAGVIRRGIAKTLEELRAEGHDACHLYISPDPAGLGTLTDRLRAERVDCIVVGGGVRLPPRNLVLFEAVLNSIAAVAPSPRIALVARPEDATASVARVLA